MPKHHFRVFALSLFAIFFSVASLHAADDVADTRVADAAEARDWDRVSKLIAGGASLAAAQPDGMTALHWAAFHNHSETVASLLKAGGKQKVDVNARTEYRITPLAIACELGSAKVVSQLVSAGADVDAEISGDVSPILLASRSGNVKVIECLLGKGADADATESRGQTPLMWAAEAGHVKAVETLIDAGADINKTNKSAFTPIMFAARQGHQAVVEVLLDAGVEVDAVMEPKTKSNRAPRKGTSALTIAVESGHFELAMMLVQRGADPNDQRSGFAPLHSLSWVRKPNRGEAPDGDPPPRGSGNLNSLQFVRALVEAGADVRLPIKKGKGGKAQLNRTGATALLLAAKTADVPYMSLLVELGADPTAVNVDGCTPLMAAAGVGVRAVGEEAGTEDEVIEALEFLVKHGNDVNAVDDNKETAMHGAGYRCFPCVVEFLAANGSDPETWNHKNESGWTPTMIAKGHRPGSFKPHPETVQAMQAVIAGSETAK